MASMLLRGAVLARLGMVLTGPVLLGVHTTRRVTDSSHGPARIALLAVAEVSEKEGTGGRPFGSVAIGQGLAMEVDEAASALALMPKPVSCQGTVADGVLRLRCGPVSQSSELLILEQRRIAANALLERVRATYAVKDSDPAVVIKGTSGTLLLPLSALKGFMTDYYVPAALSMRKPDELARRKGATAVFTLHPALRVHIEGMPRTP